MSYRREIYDWFYDLLIQWKIHSSIADYLNIAFLIIGNFIISYIVFLVCKNILAFILIRVSGLTKTQFDDYLVHNKVPVVLARLVPYLFLIELIRVLFNNNEKYSKLFVGFAEIYLVFWVITLLKACLKALRDYLKTKDEYKDKPLESFIQVVMIVAYFVGGIVLFSMLTGKSAGAFFTAMGAASAILLLVFKDTILGFVASIQVTTNDMVRIGDWITMPKHDADGDVIDISLTTVKVQNFDKSITTIPTYFLIQDSFKNWRGMQDAGGRRIKRSIRIQVTSVRFLEQDDIEKLKKIQIIKDYLEERTKEIDLYNEQQNIDTSLPVNGRHLTNIGVYRQYINTYLSINKHLNKNYTMMARQLEPTPQGIPIELYVFTNDTKWQNYEGIMGDLFDHLLVSAPFFGLEVYESPSAHTLKNIVGASIALNENSQS